MTQSKNNMKVNHFYLSFSFFETEGRHAIAKAQETIDHLARQVSVRQRGDFTTGIRSTNPSLRFGYLFTIIW
jgi:hypothetical protein